MAWFGGGSLASGELGTSGGGAIVVIATTGAVLYGFKLWDDHQDYVRVRETLHPLQGKQDFAADVACWRDLPIVVLR